MAPDNTTNYDSHSFYKEFLNWKYYSVPFIWIRKTDERFTTNTHGLLVGFDFMIFRNMPLDTIVEAVGRDEKSLQENFVYTKKVIWDKRDLFT